MSKSISHDAFFNFVFLHETFHGFMALSLLEKISTTHRVLDRYVLQTFTPSLLRRQLLWHPKWQTFEKSPSKRSNTVANGELMLFWPSSNKIKGIGSGERRIKGHSRTQSPSYARSTDGDEGLWPNPYQSGI